MSYRIYIYDPPPSFDQFGANFDQLGDNTNARGVGISVEARAKNYFSPTAIQIKQSFENAGWYIVDVALNTEDSGIYDAWQVIIGISAIVDNSFDDEAVKEGVTAVLNPDFTVQNVVVQDGAAKTINYTNDPPINTGSTGSTNKPATTGTNKPGTNKPGTNPGSNSNSNNYSYWPSANDLGLTDFFSSLGSGLGISTPIVIGGLLILGVILLKK